MFPEKNNEKTISSYLCFSLLARKLLINLKRKETYTISNNKSNELSYQLCVYAYDTRYILCVLLLLTHTLSKFGYFAVEPCTVSFEW